MTETLDPLSPSVNNSGGSASSFINKIRLRIRPGNQNRGNGEGYVEFGEFRSDSPSVKKVGTFAGVFCPVVLSMFSALVFFRMGYLIGNAGLLVTLAQFGIAYLIVLFTVISICAISTNGAIEGGGVYFMISRTLGPEFGGAIGTLFFFANVVSSALCISACTEALVENFGPGGYIISASSSGIPNGWWYRFLYRSILNLAGVCVTLCGASLFARTSLLIWAVMSVCLSSAMLSFLTTQPGPVEIPKVNTLVNVTTANFTGFSSATLYENLYPDYGKDYTSNGNMVDFASVFGVLFTGVTGVMAGANMSGELKNPSRSIPVGTLTALVITALAYVTLSVLTAATCSRFLLQNNYVYLLPINIWKPFIAVGCLLRPMAVSRSGNPVLAVIASWLLVQFGIMADELNAIAQVNSVLFMSSYFAINLACLGLELASAPNFRPSFTHFNWVTCVSGLGGCAGVMFSLRPAQSAGAALSAICLLVALHVWSPASHHHTWGSLSQALIFHQVRKYLLLLDPRRQHVKFWRPQMLLLVSSPRQQAKLIDFINVQKKGGLFVLGHVRIGQLEGNGDPLEEEYKYWLQLVDHMKVKAFVELCLSESIRSGASQLSRLSGLGAMKPDTVVVGFRDHQTPTDAFTDPLSPYRTDKFESVTGAVFPLRPSSSRLSSVEYVHILSDVVTVNKNLVVARQFTFLDMDSVVRKSPLCKYVDVWLIPPLSPHTSEEAFSVRGHFSLQLAAVVRSAKGWTHLQMRTFIVPANHTLLHEGGRTVDVDVGLSSPLPAGRSYRDRLVELLKLIRINATVHVIEDWPTLDQSTRPDGSETNQDDLYQNIPYSYLEQVNKIIRDRCREGTAVTFIQLPTPPKLNQDNLHTAEQYLNVLDVITKDLSPTLLVYGLKTVTSTAL